MEPREPPHLNGPMAGLLVGGGITLFVSLMLASLGSYAFGSNLMAAMAVAGVFVGGTFVAQAWRRRRDRQAEVEWADEVQQIVRTERVDALEHTAGGLSAPIHAGEAGSLAVADATGTDGARPISASLTDPPHSASVGGAADRLGRLRARSAESDAPPRDEAARERAR